MISASKHNRRKTDRLNCMIKVKTPLCVLPLHFFQFKEIIYEGGILFV